MYVCVCGKLFCTQNHQGCRPEFPVGGEGRPSPLPSRNQEDSLHPGLACQTFSGPGP